MSDTGDEARALPEAPRGYRLINGGGKNLERIRDIAEGRGAKVTPREARSIARLYFKAEARHLERDDEEPNE